MVLAELVALQSLGALCLPLLCSVGGVDAIAPLAAQECQEA